MIESLKIERIRSKQKTISYLKTKETRVRISNHLQV